MRYKSPSFSLPAADRAPRLIAAAGAVVSFVLLSPAVEALDPEDASLIETVSVDVPTNFNVDDDGIVYVGVGGCESMVRNDAQIAASFGTAFNPTDTTTDIFEEADTFSVERGSTARIDCRSGDLCTRVGDDDLDFTDTSISFEVPFVDLVEVMEPAECTGFDREYFVRVVVRSALGSETYENADGKIVVDTIRPSAPSGLSASATENAIHVSFDGVEDADLASYSVFWSKTGFDGGVTPGELELNSAPLGDVTSGDVVADLDPMGTVFVAVGARDEAGNFSALSGAVEINVVETSDFWESYRGAGGSERGGCATAAGPMSTWPMLLLFGMIPLSSRRRRRWLGGAIVASALVVAPHVAWADSPTHGAFGLKFGGYYPAIDEEFGGSGPFTDTFGENNLLIGELEALGWLYQGIGKIGIGGSVGFSRVKGTAAAVDPDEAGAIEETTSFGIIPFRTFLTYRMDWLAENTRIPLSAAVEGGLDFYRWRIADGAGDTAQFDGDAAVGWKRGYHYGFELQLLLDFIQPATAAAFDLHWGVNNSYFFVEYLVTSVDDFGGDGFDLSDNIWMFGLNFEI